MSTEAEKQEQNVDRYELHARIKRLGISQRYLAAQLKRTDSAISKAMDGRIPPLLNRIDRHVAYLERRRQKQQASSMERAANTLRSIG